MATPLQAAAAFDQLQGTLTRRIADIEQRLFDLVARLEASVDFPDEGYHFVAPAGARAEGPRRRNALTGARRLPPQSQKLLIQLRRKAGSMRKS